MGQAESTVQADILAYIRGCGGYAVNIGGNASMAKGTPDVLACYKGVFLGLEVKKPEESYGLTTPQRIRLKQIAKAGGVSCSVASVDDVARVIRLIDERGRP